ncbi:MAG: UvrD-helicase domain-containing protein [Nocardioidaceae bacterium]
MSSTFRPRTIETPEALRELMKAEFTFSDQQFAVVTAPLEPHVVIAGAGSGKTTVMAARVVWLVATGQVRPDQVLGLTFTTKAAHELAVRIRAGLRDAGILSEPGPRPRVAAPGDPSYDGGDPDEVEEPTVATYNAYAAGLLTEHGLRIGHEPDTRVIADASRYQLAARAIAHYTGRVEQLSDHPATVINYLLALDGAMAEHLLTPADVRAFQASQRPRVEEACAREHLKTKIAEVAKVLQTFDRREELLGLVDAYRRLKAELGLMDFSDQIELGARLATERPEVGAAERAKYRIVLLDEYQDTSVAQARMLSRLFSGLDEGSGRGHAVTAVGDPNQAIYGWRGASVSNILGFGIDFPTAAGSVDVPTYSLTVNRRSDHRILATANLLAGPLYAQFPQVRPLQAKPGAEPGVVRAAVHETYDEELAWLADQVQQAHRTMTEPRWSEIGVLTRDNKHAADVFDALTAAEIPVEIVGLQGLLRLPEVAEVVATLTLLHDLTANAEVLTLLTGPRWAIGPRDLALLGRRARELAGAAGRGSTAASVEEELAAAVEGADPTEVVSLSDALEDPGEADYSAEARERFGLLAAELRSLRRHAGEPLLDLVRRIIDVTGIDVELSSSVSPSAAARRDNLDLFVKAVAEFQAVDGDVTLPALLAYLQAEDDFGNGLDVATPTEADSVKLLTVHRAKGLEWDAVFLVGVAAEKFPTAQTRTKWTAGPGVLPSPLRGDARDLPSLGGYAAADLKAFAADSKAHELQEELRLGYVAFTRARHLLVVSSYCWTAGRKGPLGPSPYQLVVREALEEWGEKPEAWLDRPDKNEVNPLTAAAERRPWPGDEVSEEVRRRQAAAALVRAAIARLEQDARHPDGSGAHEERPDEAPPETDHPVAADAALSAEEQQTVGEWDAEMERLLAEARLAHADVVEVPLPASLSATSLARLREDPRQLAADLARPMPRPPSPSARFGTRFHAWVEARFGQQQLVDPDDLPGRVDAGIDDESELRELIDRFESGPFAERVPVAVEAPFALVLAGQVVRGRIDAVYAEQVDGRDGFLVVDWKTNRAQTADPLQLAIYRVAWAELAGVPVERVRAAFAYVRSGDVVEPGELLDRPALEALLSSP